jgi:hypothetical protein
VDAIDDLVLMQFWRSETFSMSPILQMDSPTVFREPEESPFASWPRTSNFDQNARQTEFGRMDAAS